MNSNWSTVVVSLAVSIRESRNCFSFLSGSLGGSGRTHRESSTIILEKSALLENDGFVKRRETLRIRGLWMFCSASDLLGRLTMELCQVSL